MKLTGLTFEELLDLAFRATCEAEKIIYAGGLPRDEKDAAIVAHSALLKLKLIHPVKERRAA